MKPREVELTLRVITDAPLAMLRKPSNYNDMLIKAKVLQAQASVVEPWDVKEATHGR